MLYEVITVSIYGSGVEKRDWRKVADWQMVVYDDNHWSTARVVDGVNGTIWSGLQRRDMPFMTEWVEPLSQPLAYRCGHVAEHEHEGMKLGWETAVAQPLA